MTLRFKEGQPSVLNGDPYVLHTNGTLEIHVAQPLHSGKYTCIAKNDLGSRENHVHLQVKGEPRAERPLRPILLTLILTLT